MTDLDEAPRVKWIPEDRWEKVLNDDEVRDVVKHLFEMREAA